MQNSAISKDVVSILKRYAVNEAAIHDLPADQVDRMSEDSSEMICQLIGCPITTKAEALAALDFVIKELPQTLAGECRIDRAIMSLVTAVRAYQAGH
jgi:hypothetical protein